MKKDICYLKLSFNHFKKGDTLKADHSGERLLVLNANCKDQWWKKVLRYFWFRIPNHEGDLKVKRIPHIPYPQYTNESYHIPPHLRHLQIIHEYSRNCSG